MKKIISMLMACAMMVSAIPVAHAASTTNVTVVGEGGQYYVTVPTSISPDEGGSVRVYGKWASHETVKVWTDSTVQVTHKATKATTEVNVTFDGIESLGNDLAEMDISKPISVDHGNIIFGEWNGVIEYNVEFKSPNRIEAQESVLVQVESYDPETGKIVIKPSDALVNSKYTYRATFNDQDIALTTIDNNHYSFIAAEKGEYKFLGAHPSGSPTIKYPISIY